ncbi:Hypothetical protein NTJ_09682 [Nesidiocoris tenuis]|uniref:Uncharacterized protein n=1 Tax=Nesidiocoris tenuis TaxID=355587 RepID=A0ABN7AZW6_9HEMI|nr:Hypothetical protein NTJ_09682 [Nesidiocoris tenuis]
MGRGEGRDDGIPKSAVTRKTGLEMLQKTPAERTESMYFSPIYSGSSRKGQVWEIRWSGPPYRYGSGKPRDEEKGGKVNIFQRLSQHSWERTVARGRQRKIYRKT